MEITIKLKIKGVEIELDLKEARELKEILEGITGKKVEKEKEYVPYYPWTYPWTITWATDSTSSNTDYIITYNAQK